MLPSPYDLTHAIINEGSSAEGLHIYSMRFVGSAVLVSERLQCLTCSPPFAFSFVPHPEAHWRLLPHIDFPNTYSVADEKRLELVCGKIMCGSLPQHHLAQL